MGFKLANPVTGKTLKEYNKKCDTRVNTMDLAVGWLSNLFCKNVHALGAVDPQPELEMNRKILKKVIEYLNELITYMSEEVNY